MQARSHSALSLCETLPSFPERRMESRISLAVSALTGIGWALAVAGSIKGAGRGESHLGQSCASGRAEAAG